MRYTFDGQIVGYTSNNGTSDTDYAADIAQHTTATGSGYYRNGGTSASAYADFDQSYDPLNGDSVDATSSSYTVAGGDTLQSIAQAVWGDSSLWYLIADANGLNAGSALALGSTISIPICIEARFREANMAEPCRSAIRLFQ
jgi:nucleoid-associated protein YgaU